ncbi:MAG TPA: alpha/beta fold hydrolase [Thermoanaerobaculia bacterium]|nr:alpha/beta fold hydrolase [Thermoanaerobaculia bacterium]
MIAHRVTGNPSGPPLLLLNGGLMTIAAWEPIAAPLGESWKVIRCDFQGQLLSPGEPEPRLQAHVDDVIALLDELRIERTHVAGASFGALVGLLLAAGHPERVASISAITATERILPEMWESSARLRDAALAAADGGDGGVVYDLLIPATYSPSYLEANAATLALYRRQIALMPAVWFRGVVGILSALEGLDLRPVLPRIEAPALVVGAGEDRVFPPEHSWALGTSIPGAKLVMLPGAAHGAIVEEPARVAEMLREFLEPLS